MELKDKISSKFVLLDTGVIIRAFENFDNFEAFFKMLEDANCRSVYFPFIEFEFLRGAYEISHRHDREQFLKEISGISLNQPNHTIIKDAIAIANCYSARKHYSASLTDCCIAAYLKTFTDNLFLVTLNHKDFPTFLFDRVGIHPIDAKTDIFTLAFYKYNQAKAEKIGLK
jgi:predicted nucleic acid-binding protein